MSRSCRARTARVTSSRTGRPRRFVAGSCSFSADDSPERHLRIGCRSCSVGRPMSRFSKCCPIDLVRAQPPQVLGPLVPRPAPAARASTTMTPARMLLRIASRNALALVELVRALAQLVVDASAALRSSTAAPRSSSRALRWSTAAPRWSSPAPRPSTAAPRWWSRAPRWSTAALRRRSRAPGRCAQLVLQPVAAGDVDEDDVAPSVCVAASTSGMTCTSRYTRSPVGARATRRPAIDRRALGLRLLDARAQFDRAIRDRGPEAAGRVVARSPNSARRGRWPATTSVGGRRTICAAAADSNASVAKPVEHRPLHGLGAVAGARRSRLAVAWHRAGPWRTPAVVRSTA